MNYDQFKERLKSELPLNRKERFYTGTVLPSILFHNGLANFFRFLKEIDGLPKSIDQEKTKDDFLFYTEYNLKQSAGKKSVGVGIYTDTGDTPDVIIEILEPEKVFIFIEAKMFAKPTQNEFKNQMAAQKFAVIDSLTKEYSLDDKHIFHIALTPRQLGFTKTDDYQVINWEFFIDNADIDIQDNYFAHFLKFALEGYDKLVCDQSGMASTVEKQERGSKVYWDGIDQRTLWVGRKGGKRKIEEDVKKDIWEDKLYATNTQKPLDGQKGNWISSQEFASIVDRMTKGFPIIPGRWYACELMGDFFKDFEDACSYSPIRIDSFELSESEDGAFVLTFYHANYPDGVREKHYRVKVLAWGDFYMMVKSLNHSPVRILRLYEIDTAWISRHFVETEVNLDDVQAWLNRRFRRGLLNSQLIQPLS